MPQELANFHSRWDALFRGMGSPPVRHHEFDQLVRHYREPHRGYHTLAHVADCLHLFDSVRHLVPRDADTIEAAIWFHDVIYDPRATDNEGASADYAAAALLRLGSDERFVREVHRLIGLTRHRDLPTDLPGQVMVDVDLASLGALPAVFDQNGQNIRREFAHVDDATYRRARADILRKFEARHRIYLTDAFFSRYEQAARSNLRRAIAALHG